MNVVAGMCAALNKIPFINFDYSGITDKAEEYAQKAADANNKLDYTDVGAAFDTYIVSCIRILPMYRQL